MFTPEMITDLRCRLGMNRNEFTTALGLKTRMTTRYWERGIKIPNLQSTLKLIQLARTVGLDWRLEDFQTPGNEAGA